jgi:hypothetical protein
MESRTFQAEIVNFRPLRCLGVSDTTEDGGHGTRLLAKALLGNVKGAGYRQDPRLRCSHIALHHFRNPFLSTNMVAISGSASPMWPLAIFDSNRCNVAQ